MAINTIFKSVGSSYERNLDGKQIVTQCNFDTTSKGGYDESVRLVERRSNHKSAGAVKTNQDKRKSLAQTRLS